MCGIAGIISSDAATVATALETMIDAQAHRGPDGSGQSHAVIMDNMLGLGHRRLAIIDLTATGAQPMVHPRTGDRLVYNGEIYNHRDLRVELSARGCVFQGGSDSEVLLHALAEWGPGCIRRLEGMFAFAFLHAASGDVLLARDPLGIKPLYIGRSRRALLFASEVRPILRTGLVSDAIDARGMASFLSYGALQHPFTMFEEISSFPPGCWQRIRVGRQEDRPVRYWEPPRPDARLDGRAAVHAVRATVDAAVRDHLVSDVPVGIFLSSGLDSSIVAGLAARHAPGLRSFTVGFAENPDLSELNLAGETARRLGLDHTECHIEAADALKAAVDWLASLDLPSIDGLNVYAISKAVRERGFKVALSGQGGDELFGGYATFSDVPRLYRMMSKVSVIPPSVRSRFANIATLGRPETVRAKASAIAACDGGLLSLYTQRRRLMTPAQLRRFGFDAKTLGLTSDYLDPAEADAFALDSDVVWSVSQMESRFYLGNMLLRDGDADSMAHGLEVRVPLLDRRLLDLAAGLPGHLRLPTGRPDKHLFRTAFPELLRPDLLRQPKRGFALPIRRWMLGPLSEICRSGLEHLKATGMLAPTEVDAVWASYVAAPETPSWSRAFACCVVGHYLHRCQSLTALRLAS